MQRKRQTCVQRYQTLNDTFSEEIMIDNEGNEFLPESSLGLSSPASDTPNWLSASGDVNKKGSLRNIREP